jgi:hypothetical protein
VTPFSWQQFKYVGLMFFVLVLVVPLLLGAQYLREHGNRLLGCYLACAMGLGLVTVAKAGSDVHYWLEAVLVLSALVAALVAERVVAKEGIVEVLCLLFVVLFFSRLFTPAGPQRQDFVRDRALQAFLRENFSPGTTALSPWAGDLARAGLDLPVSDPDQFNLLVRKGILSDRLLLDPIRGCRFSVIAIDYDLRVEPPPRGARFPRAWSEAILGNYKLAASLDMPDTEKVWPDDRFYIWVPKALDEVRKNE